MKNIAYALALGLLLTGRIDAKAASPWAGHLDLTPDVNGFGAASFTDSTKLGGLDKRGWYLEKNGQEEFELDPFVGFNTSQTIGGLEIAVPSGGISQVVSLIERVKTLPPTLVSVLSYTQYLKDGVLVGYNLGRITGAKPAFIGYKVSVGF